MKVIARKDTSERNINKIREVCDRKQSSRDQGKAEERTKFEAYEVL